MQVGIEGACKVVEALRINASLCELNISANKLDGGGGALAAALVGVKVLKELELQENAFNDDEKKNLQAVAHGPDTHENLLLAL